MYRVYDPHLKDHIYIYLVAKLETIDFGAFCALWEELFGLSGLLLL